MRDEQAATAPSRCRWPPRCHQALQSLHEALEAAGGELRILIPAELRVNGKRAYFQSIFHNLISNAMKYRADARPLRIDIVATTAAQAERLRGATMAWALTWSGQATASFSSTGRLHLGQPGAGVGLGTCARPRRSHGWQVAVASRPDEGTEFTLNFRPDRTKSYLIDDDDLAIDLTEQLLRTEKSSNCICTFQLAEEALDKLVGKTQRHTPAVFLDLNMPLMDGWQFLDALAAYQDALRGTCHIYILTSSLALKDLEKSRQYALVAGLIHKPLDSKEIQAIQSLFECDDVSDDEPCDC